MRNLKKRKNIEIAVRQAVSSFPIGAHRSLLFGSGGEFQVIREWQPGDRRPSVSATARLGKPMFKVFEEPKGITVWLLLDGSPSMNFGSVQKKVDVACALCLMFGFSVDSVGDKLSVAVFGRDQVFFIDPAIGSNVAFSAIDFLLDEKPCKQNTSLLEALSLVLAREATNSLVIIISDFCFELSTTIKDHIRHIGSLRNTSLLSVVVEDEQEDNLPTAPLLANIFDSEDQKHLPIDLRSISSRNKILTEELRSLNSHVALVKSADKHFKNLAKLFGSLLLCK